MTKEIKQIQELEKRINLVYSEYQSLDQYNVNDYIRDYSYVIQKFLDIGTSLSVKEDKLNLMNKVKDLIVNLMLRNKDFVEKCITNIFQQYNSILTKSFIENHLDNSFQDNKNGTVSLNAKEQSILLKNITLNGGIFSFIQGTNDFIELSKKGVNND